MDQFNVGDAQPELGLLVPSVLDACAADIAALSEELDSFGYENSEPNLTAARAALARGLFLTGAAIDVARGEFAEAAGALARPAVECWIFCMDLVHTGPESLLDIFGDGVSREVRIAQKVNPGSEFQSTVEKQQAMRQLIALAKAANAVGDDWTPRRQLQTRFLFERAIESGGFSSHWLSVYDGLYSALSTFDTHVPAALLTHLVESDGEVYATRRPTPWIDTPAMLANVTLLMIGAAGDVFSKIGSFDSRWAARYVELVEVLKAYGLQIVAQAAEHDDPALRAFAAQFTQAFS